MDQPVVPFDLARMFLGDDPPLFYLEIVVRCLVIYGYTLLALRWIGGRSVTQLSLVEFLLVIAIGSAVGDAPLYPDVPLLQALTVITVVVLLNKLLDRAILHSDLAKRVVDGGPVRVIEAGRILMDDLLGRAMGPAELTAALRNAGYRNLGEVDAAYVEANGKLSLYRAETPRPGLRIAPPHEIADLDAEDPRRGDGPLCCGSCGVVLAAPAIADGGSCPECGAVAWTRPETARG